MCCMTTLSICTRKGMELLWSRRIFHRNTDTRFLEAKLVRDIYGTHNGKPPAQDQDRLQIIFSREWNFDGQETFGMLYIAEVRKFEDELHNEIEKIVITKELPTTWTYPDIQPKLIEEAWRRAIILCPPIKIRPITTCTPYNIP